MYVCSRADLNCSNSPSTTNACNYVLATLASALSFLSYVGSQRHWPFFHVANNALTDCNTQVLFAASAVKGTDMCIVSLCSLTLKVHVSNSISVSQSALVLPVSTDVVLTVLFTQLSTVNTMALASLWVYSFIHTASTQMLCYQISVIYHIASIHVQILMLFFSYG